MNEKDKVGVKEMDKGKFNCKKSFIFFLILVLFAAFGFYGCASWPSEDPPQTIECSDEAGSSETEGQPADSGLGEFLPLDFIFSSGAGAWATALVIYPDGSFVGEYHDSDMGDMGESYPHGTVYTSKFSGHFDEITSLDKDSFLLKLGDLVLEKEPGEEWIEEEIRYISSDAHGIKGGDEFILYKPGTPAADLPETFLHWWPDWYRMSEGELTELNCWGLLNVNTEDGFFTSTVE